VASKIPPVHVPNTAPVVVLKYLLPNESKVVLVRQHPALLAPAFIAASGGLLIAAAVGGFPHKPYLALITVWLCVAFLILRFCFVVLNWWVQYIVVTGERFMLFSGYLNPRVTTIDLPELRDLTFERSYGGRMLGYGALTIESGGRSQTLIDYVPYPEQIYLEIRGVVLQDYDQDDDQDYDSDDNTES
jgi:hypothetical protein